MFCPLATQICVTIYRFHRSLDDEKPRKTYRCSSTAVKYSGFLRDVAPIRPSSLVYYLKVPNLCNVVHDYRLRQFVRDL